MLIEWVVVCLSVSELCDLCDNIKMLTGLSVSCVGLVKVWIKDKIDLGEGKIPQTIKV